MITLEVFAELAKLSRNNGRVGYIVSVKNYKITNALKNYIFQDIY